MIRKSVHERLFELALKKQADRKQRLAPKKPAGVANPAVELRTPLQFQRGLEGPFNIFSNLIPEDPEDSANSCPRAPEPPPAILTQCAAVDICVEPEMCEECSQLQLKLKFALGTEKELIARLCARDQQIKDMSQTPAVSDKALQVPDMTGYPQGLLTLVDKIEKVSQMLSLCQSSSRCLQTDIISGLIRCGVSVETPN
ncbi:MAG: uncharacterized protein KVP18_004010 [Porospora cf. gigantea A]|uniref:uncharacterized protein n=1 Tax=Porospora cf. gigantea A TaxID=2853593 RepID=UPI00355AB66E|nr:MAG: hypothetical protein KVP18_004010 [Porospora cf. gigantea A]